MHASLSWLGSDQAALAESITGIKRGYITTTLHTHRFASLMVLRNTTLVPPLGLHTGPARGRPQRWYVKAAHASPQYPGTTIVVVVDVIIIKQFYKVQSVITVVIRMCTQNMHRITVIRVKWHETQQLYFCPETVATINYISTMHDKLLKIQYAYFTYAFPDFHCTDVIALQGNGPVHKHQHNISIQTVNSNANGLNAILYSYITMKYIHKIDGHSVERTYLRHRCSDGAVNKAILKSRLTAAAGRQ